jgi:hypothetical protein
MIAKDVPTTLTSLKVPPSAINEPSKTIKSLSRLYTMFIAGEIPRNLIRKG